MIPRPGSSRGGGLRWLGLRIPAGRGPSFPHPPPTPSSCLSPPRYLPAEPHDPVQLGFILKQIPELPGAKDPEASRAAGLRPRPRRPGPVHTARPRPQLGCWLGPIGPAPPRLRSGLRAPAPAPAPAARCAVRGPPPGGASIALKGAAAAAGSTGGGAGRGRVSPGDLPPVCYRATANLSLKAASLQKPILQPPS